MDALADYGYVGMFIAAFIAGSVFPFSSEAIMTALLVAGLSPVQLFWWGTTGNVAGSMFNYGVGRLGRLEWIERYLHVKKEKIDSTQRFMENRGAWIGVLCFVPVLGSAIAVTLGFMRSNAWTSLISISIGKAVRYALLIIAVLGLASCGNGGGQQQAAGGQQAIAVSIEPLRWAAEQVVGTDCEVKVIVPRGGNPETFEPTAKDMITLSEAAYFFHTGGLGFELAGLGRMQQNAPGTRFVSVGMQDGSHERQHLHDPHVWVSPQGMRRIIDIMARTLARQADFTATLRVDSAMREVPRGTAFAIYHPSLTSLADDYGLKQICIEADGKEPSPARLARVIDECRRNRVHVVFLQQEFDRRGAEQIASQIGASVVTINPLGHDWPQEMMRIAAALAANADAEADEEEQY